MGASWGRRGKCWAAVAIGVLLSVGVFVPSPAAAAPGNLNAVVVAPTGHFVPGDAGFTSAYDGYAVLLDGRLATFHMTYTEPGLSFHGCRPSNWTGAFDLTLVGGGDRLSATFVGPACPGPAPLLGINVDNTAVTVTGGTGSFAGATGYGRFNLIAAGYNSVTGLYQAAGLIKLHLTS